MVWRNTTRVPSLGLRIGPACEAGLSAGMRKEHVSPQIRKEERKTIDVNEIWFVDKFWPSVGKDINKYETGSSIERPQQPYWKIDKRHISVVAVDPEWHDNNGAEVKIETE